MGYYLQAVVGDPSIWTETFGSNDASLAGRLRGHADPYVRYLIGQGGEDGRDRNALARALNEYVAGEVSGTVAADFLGTIAHAVMRAEGEPLDGRDVSVGEALELADVWGEASPIVDTQWPIPIGPTEWCLVGVISPRVCAEIATRAAARHPTQDSALGEILRWVERAVVQERSLILFAS